MLLKLLSKLLPNLLPKHVTQERYSKLLLKPLVTLRYSKPLPKNRFPKLLPEIVTQNRYTKP